MFNRFSTFYLGRKNHCLSDREKISCYRCWNAMSNLCPLHWWYLIAICSYRLLSYLRFGDCVPTPMLGEKRHLNWWGSVDPEDLLLGGFFTPPKNMSSSVEMMKFPIFLGKKKHAKNHQPVIISVCSCDSQHLGWSRGACRRYASCSVPS